MHYSVSPGARGRPIHALRDRTSPVYALNYVTLGWSCLVRGVGPSLLKALRQDAIECELDRAVAVPRDRPRDLIVRNGCPLPLVPRVLLGARVGVRRHRVRDSLDLRARGCPGIV